MPQLPAESTATPTFGLFPIPNQPEVTQYIFKRARKQYDPADGRMIIHQRLTADEKKMLHQRLTALNPANQSATKREIAKSVSQMLTGWNSASAKSDAEAAAVVSQFTVVLLGLPAFAIERACLRWARGEVKPEEVFAKKIDWSFPPSAAQVRLIAEHIVRGHRDEALIIHRLLEAKVEKEVQATPEAKVRVSHMIEDIRANQAAADTEAVRQESLRREQAQQILMSRHRAQLEREYFDRGLEPVYADAAKTMVVSLPMMLANGARIEQVRGKTTLVRPSKAHVDSAG